MGNRKHKTSAGSHVVRHLAPFVPVAVALLLGRALLSPGGGAPAAPAGAGGALGMPVPAKCDDVSDFMDCHSRFPTGCSQAAGYDAYLNLLKNQLIQPSAAANPVKFLAKQDFVDLDNKLPPELKGDNHADFKDALAQLGEGQVYGLDGYLYYAKPSGVESSNCQLPNDDTIGTNVDFHIGIGFDPALADKIRTHTSLTASESKTVTQSSVIVEMTPHYRFEFEHGQWTIDAIRKVLGRQVRLVGQLLVDSEHNIPSQNCALAKTDAQRTSCWRASTWELHPVIQFEVCKKTAGACGNSAADWEKLSPNIN